MHTYAFSVAANAILSLCPFLVMMFVIAHQVFHSRAMEYAVVDMVRYFLPAGQDFVARNMAAVANSRRGLQLASLLMLAVSSTGIFLPLETALNRVWGVSKNRSYLMNQVISLLLALSMGVLAMTSVALTAMQRSILTHLFFNHTDNFVYAFLAHSLLQSRPSSSASSCSFLFIGFFPGASFRCVPSCRPRSSWACFGKWQKLLYIFVLPWLDFRSVYGPFSISVSLMMWAFLTGLLLLAGAQHSASRHALRLAREADHERARQDLNATEHP